MWNDVGITTQAEFSSATVDAWAVQGLDMMASEVTTEEIPVLNFSSGLRMNVQVTQGLRMGGSYAGG
jgi:hypothetical protein